MLKKPKKIEFIPPKVVRLTKVQFRFAKQEKFYWQGIDLLDADTHVCIIARESERGLINYSHWWNKEKRFNRTNVPQKYR